MEGDAGERSQLNPADPGEPESPADGPPEGGGTRTSDEVVTDEVVTEAPADPGPENPESSPRPPSRLGRAWLAGICAILLLLSAGVATGGYLALRAHRDSMAQAREDSIALQAAKDCVAATQAPDTEAMAASQRKMIDCSTGDYAVQATVFSSLLVDAYQAANVRVKVADMRAAIERHNDDGSVLVLVAFKVLVTNSQTADQQAGYRLRVQMAPADGTYKIARLDQVAS